MSHSSHHDHPGLNGLSGKSSGLNITLAGVILVGGGFFLTRTIVRHIQANAQQRQSLSEGSYATYAKQIKMAFDNDGYWGTDKEQLRTTIIAIPTQSDFDHVVKSYTKLYRRNMLADMESERKATEYNEMIAIVSAKPTGHAKKAVADKTKLYRGWAQRLKAAFDITYGFIPGTDEKAIKAVFTEIPTQSDYNQVGITYQNLYGNKLSDDLKHELEAWEISDYLKIITDKPKS